MPPALDPVAFGSLVDMLDEIGPEVFVDVLELYLKDAPPRARSLDRLGDTELRREAHGLRGSAASIGAIRLASLCEALEEAPQGAALAPRVTAIQAEMARVVTEVRAALARAA